MLSVEDDGDVEAEEEAGRDMEAYERAYADDRSWEDLQEDESGLLRVVDVAQQQRQHRKRVAAMAGAHIQRGIIRYLYLLVDLSRAAGEIDFRPSRMGIVANCVEAFVREFFDQNPLSHLGIITLHNGVAHCLTDLSGSPEMHIKALRTNLECAGDASIQNAIDLARGLLCQIPTYAHRETLLIFSALSTCDPGDIMEAVQRCKDANIRCSVVGLVAEIYICKLLCEQTGGNYSVATSETHLKDLIMEHAPPPPVLAESAVASLVRMGFPQRGAEDAVALCACHGEVKIGGGYICPCCKARICELPTECHICGLMLVSSPHLARSYHHLFPVPHFEELGDTAVANGKETKFKLCYGCQQELPFPGGKVSGVRLVCPRCRQHFCYDCDLYIHESLHNCPGCESISSTSSLPDLQK